MSVNGKYDLQERLITFSVSIIELVRKLSDSKESRYFGGQILRSGSAPALICAEAQAAESRKDFIHKMKLCQKELRETSVNLRIMSKTEIAKPSSIEPIFKECGELNAILYSSIQTAQKNINA
ncbi:MAG: four helix bundle protein [Flavobacteriales bacterium]|nr:four helix bundle protein [Flavobacteriales bacterium]